jgi:hypothetical protein
MRVRREPSVFVSLKTLYSKIVFENELKMPFRPLWNMTIFETKYNVFFDLCSNKIRKTENEHLNIVCQNLNCLYFFDVYTTCFLIRNYWCNV